MGRPIDIRLRGGVILLTPAGLLPPRLTRGDGWMVDHAALVRLRRDRGGLAALRRDFHRLALPYDPRHATDLQLVAAVELAVERRRLDLHWLADDLSLAPAETIDIVRDRPALVRHWTPAEKIVEGLTRARPALGREFDRPMAQLFQPEALAWGLPALVALAEPAGRAPLLAFAYQVGGVPGVQAMSAFADATAECVAAEDERQLDRATGLYAEFLALLGPRLVSAVVDRLRKRGIQGNAEADSPRRVKPAGSRLPSALPLEAARPLPVREPEPEPAAIDSLPLDYVPPPEDVEPIPGRLEVIVLLEPDDQLLKGVRISVSGGISDERVSKPGQEAWGPVPPGDYSATASYEGLESVSGSVTVPPGQTGQIILRMKPVVKVKLISLTFNSDHQEKGGAKLLKRASSEVLQRERLVWNYDTNQNDKVIDSFTSWYTNFHTEYKKPEWTIERGGAKDSHPISQTKDTVLDVTLLVDFEVRPKFATVPLTNVFGSAGPESTQFEAEYEMRVKDKERVKFPNLTAKAPLPNAVYQFDHMIDWWFTLNGEIIDVGATGPHRIYVTFDRPIGAMQLDKNGFFEEAGKPQIITDRRLELAVADAWGKGAKGEQECVDAIFKAQADRGVNYILGRRYSMAGNTTGLVPKPSIPHYLWLCNTNEAQGECHNIAAGFQLECRAIGCSGSFELGYMIPYPSRLDVPPLYPKMTLTAPAAAGPPTAQGKFSGNYPYTRYYRQHVDSDHAGTWETVVFLDGRGRANNFEGVTCYNNFAMYAIGDAVFDAYSSKDDNAAAYFAMRDPASDPIRSVVTDWSRGWAKLWFAAAGTKDPCALPYPFSSAPDFKWED